MAPDAIPSTTPFVLFGEAARASPSAIHARQERSFEMVEPLKTTVSPGANAEPASDARQGPAQPAPDPKSAQPDPFDPAALRLDQSFETPAVRKLLTTVPVRKPLPQHFVRVHPGADFRGPFALIEFKEEREFFLISREIARELPGEYRTCNVYTAITRQEKIFLWPIRLPDSDGRYNDWHRSQAEAALLAQTKWLRLKSDKALGAYEVAVAEAELSEPVWPEHSFHDILRVAFKDRLVDNLDHLVIKKLRGLV
jgi:hypothetical protein